MWVKEKVLLKFSKMLANKFVNYCRSSPTAVNIQKRTWSKAHHAADDAQTRWDWNTNSICHSFQNVPLHPSFLSFFFLLFSLHPDCTISSAKFEKILDSHKHITQRNRMHKILNHSSDDLWKCALQRTIFVIFFFFFYIPPKTPHRTACESRCVRRS